jgi:hypothetical protein
MRRLTFYQRCRQQTCLWLPVRRGPKTNYTDEQLAAEIRRTIQKTPLHGEGHCKVRARLRLTREHELLAPQRQPQPVEPKRHGGTILAERFKRDVGHRRHGRLHSPGREGGHLPQD